MKVDPVVMKQSFLTKQPLLPLVPEPESSEGASKESSSKFQLSSRPGVDDTARYTIIIRHLDGSECLRDAI